MVRSGSKPGARGDLGHWGQWRMGPLFLAWVERAQTRGLLVSTHGTRLVPAAGFGGAVTGRLGNRFSLVLGASAMAVARFATAEFRVDAQQIFTPAVGLLSAEAALRFSF